MKIHLSKLRDGGTLMATLLIALIVAGILSSYLVLVSNENTMIARSQAWNTSLVVAEAGIEEGMAMININGATANDVTTWPGLAVANGWTVNGNVYTLTRYVGTTSNYYVVTITNLNPVAVIKSVGYVPWNVGFEPTNTLSRAILVTNGTSGFAGGGILVKKGMTFSGNVLIDGFNSQDPNYSTNGQYILSKHNAGATVATLESNVLAAIDPSGSSKIYGKAYTGPGSTISYAGTASIGNTNWVDGGNSGLESGWGFNDLNVSIPDAPAYPGYTAGIVRTMVGIVHNSKTNVLLASGIGTTNIYTTNGIVALENTTTLLITNGPGTGHGGTVVLNCSSLVFGNSGVLTIATNIVFVLNTTGTPGLSQSSGSGGVTNMPNSTFILNAPGGFTVGAGTGIVLSKGANFIAYVGGSSTISGAGFVNSQYATNVYIYGSTACTNITDGAGGSLMGVIYAPYASLNFTGGGTMTGSAVGNSVAVQNGFTFHYDESIPSQTTFAAYVISSWQEISP
jgi:hypothetical protein